MVHILPPVVVRTISENIVLPKLSAVVDSWVRTWATTIPIHHMLPLMDIFFNKWQQVLYHWLCSSFHFEEVTKWFLGWMELLPPQLLANDHIQCRLFVGMNMVNQAAKGMKVVQPDLGENISYLRALEKRQFETKAAAQVQQYASANLNGGLQGDGKDSGSKLSLKEIIEAHAQQNGVLLKPKPGRIHDGHQIYGFGSISIVIDSLNEKVFVQTEDKWSRVSLELLLELHHRYSLKRR